MNRDFSRGLASSDQSLFQQIDQHKRRETLLLWVEDLLVGLMTVIGLLSLMIDLEVLFK